MGESRSSCFRRKVLVDDRCPAKLQRRTARLLAVRLQIEEMNTAGMWISLLSSTGSVAPKARWRHGIGHLQTQSEKIRDQLPHPLPHPPLKARECRPSQMIKPELCPCASVWFRGHFILTSRLLAQNQWISRMRDCHRPSSVVDSLANPVG